MTQANAGPAWSAWYGDVAWRAGDRRHSELGWTIAPGVDPRGYSYHVLVVDQATEQPLAASEPAPFPGPLVAP